MIAAGSWPALPRDLRLDALPQSLGLALIQVRDNLRLDPPRQLRMPAPESLDQRRGPEQSRSAHRLDAGRFQGGIVVHLRHAGDVHRPAAGQNVRLSQTLVNYSRSMALPLHFIGHAWG